MEGKSFSKNIDGKMKGCYDDRHKIQKVRKGVVRLCSSFW